MTYDPTVDGPVRDPKDARAVKPRHAATLVLVRRDRGRPEVLMGKRHASHKFMPNKYVFPGGRVDRKDYTAKVAGDLRPDVLARVSRGANERLARALAVAAVRETMEEAGLMLGRPAVSGGPLLPSLDVLDFVFRAITPPYRPRRFDTRFFIADAHNLFDTDLDAPRGSGELLTLQWVTAVEARDLDLPNITKVVVREIDARLSNPGTVRPVPFTRFIRGKAVTEHIEG